MLSSTAGTARPVPRVYCPCIGDPVAGSLMHRWPAAPCIGGPPSPRRPEFGTKDLRAGPSFTNKKYTCACALQYGHACRHVARECVQACVKTCICTCPPALLSSDGQNWKGHNYIGHNGTGHKDVGHSCIGHNYVGHNYVILRRHKRNSRLSCPAPHLYQCVRLIMNFNGILYTRGAALCPPWPAEIDHQRIM